MMLRTTAIWVIWLRLIRAQLAQDGDQRVQERGWSQKRQGRWVKFWIEILIINLGRELGFSRTWFQYFLVTFAADSVEAAMRLSWDLTELGVVRITIQGMQRVLWPYYRSPQGSSVHGILQARILEWVAMPFSRGSSWSRDQTQVSFISCIGRQVLYQ